MKRILKLLAWPVARRKVDASFVPEMTALLDSMLSARELRGIVSPSLLQRLVEEAYARAGSDEADGVPYYGELLSQIEKVADEVASIYLGNWVRDTRLYTILVHHASYPPPGSST